MNNPMDFSNKKILVTGASSGIGRAAAVYLSGLGARIAGIGRNEARLLETQSMLKGTGHRVICMDLASVQDMSELFDTITEDGVRLDGIIHSAGVTSVVPLKLLKRGALEDCMNINLFAFIELVRQYAKKKYNNGGSIVGISSLSAVLPAKCETAYCASKSAMNITVQTLAMELASKNIRINSVMPGRVNTAMANDATSGLGNQEYIEQHIGRQILGIEEPEDIAGICAFLLSDASRAITGRALYADGGCLR